MIVSHTPWDFTICPLCGEGVEGGSFEVEGSKVLQDQWCTACSGVWTTVYEAKYQMNISAHPIRQHDAKGRCVDPKRFGCPDEPH